MAFSILAPALRAFVFGALLGSASAYAACPKLCLKVDSVVHAAGVPSDLALAAQKVEFAGDKLSGDSKKTVGELAKQVKLLPASAVAALTVSADGGLGGAAAKAQAQARRSALAAALGQAGLTPARFKLNVD